MSIVQLSRFSVSLFSDNFFILPNSLSLVKNFFIFLLPAQATACIDYHTTSYLSTTFSKLFQHYFRFRTPVALQSLAASVLLLLSVMCLSFSATNVILSSHSWIVNVFSLFYIFRTIQAIQSIQTIYHCVYKYISFSSLIQSSRLLFSLIFPHAKGAVHSGRLFFRLRASSFDHIICA